MTETNDRSGDADALVSVMAKDIEAHWTRLEGNISALDNWLLAALVALNGGGAITLANIARDVPGDVVLPAMCFVGGSATAVLSAIVRRDASRRHLDKLLEARHAAIDPPDDTLRPTTLFGLWVASSWLRAFRPTSARSRCSTLLLAISLTGYVIGCIMLILTWEAHSTSVARMAPQQKTLLPTSIQP